MAGFYGGYMGNAGGLEGLVAGGPSFDINRVPGALGGRSGEQLKRLYEGGTQQNQQLNEELKRRGIMPGGPQLPFAFQNNMQGVPMGNMAGLLNGQFYGGPQMRQQVPPGFQNKYVS
jgi:hypothetical protein